MGRGYYLDRFVFNPANPLQISPLRGLHGLETNLLYPLLTIAISHQKRCAVITCSGLQRANTKLRSAILAIELYLKVFDTVYLEEILQNSSGLRTAVAITFGRKPDFNGIIGVLH